MDNHDAEWKLVDKVYKLAARAKVLADYPLPVLRRTAAENSTNNHTAKQETLGMSRGELIEKILVDEFLD